jgi:hypothetical protein
VLTNLILELCILGSHLGFVTRHQGLSMRHPGFLLVLASLEFWLGCASHY